MRPPPCAALALALFLLTPSAPLRAETLGCAGGNFTVIADSHDVASTACHAVTSTREALAECGLGPSRPIAGSVVNDTPPCIRNSAPASVFSMPGPTVMPGPTESS